MAKLSGAELITQQSEKNRANGKTVEQDRLYMDGELVQAAQAILQEDIGWFPESWDEKACKKMLAVDYKKRLAHAGALIAAEIDRYQAEEDDVQPTLKSEE